MVKPPAFRLHSNHHRRQDGDRLFHNAEMGPTDGAQNQSQLNVFTASPGEHIIHCNKCVFTFVHISICAGNYAIPSPRYLRLQIPEMTGKIIESSEDRMETFRTFPAPRSKAHIVQMLGDTSGKRHTVFRENGGDEFIKTIAVGIFDCQRRTWELYADNPKTNAPMATLPIVLKETLTAGQRAIEKN